MSKVTLQLQGDKLNVTLPDEVRAQLGLRSGQEMEVTPFANGLSLTKVDAELERQLALVDEVLLEQAESLQALASR